MAQCPPCGDPYPQGICRVGCVVGLASPALGGPCRTLQETSKFTEKLVKSSSGGEVYALIESIDHAADLRGFFALSTGMSPGMVVFEDCESLLTRLRNKKTIAE